MNGIDDSDRHIMKCNQDDCMVCDSYLEELREKWGWVWFIIVTNRPDDVNQDTLDAYQ